MPITCSLLLRRLGMREFTGARRASEKDSQGRATKQKHTTTCRRPAPPPLQEAKDGFLDLAVEHVDAVDEVDPDGGRPHHTNFAPATACSAKEVYK